MCPYGKEPIDNVWNGEAPLNQPLSQYRGMIRFLLYHWSNLITVGCFLLVQGLTLDPKAIQK